MHTSSMYANICTHICILMYVGRQDNVMVHNMMELH